MSSFAPRRALCFFMLVARAAIWTLLTNVTKILSAELAPIFAYRLLATAPMPGQLSVTGGGPLLNSALLCQRRWSKRLEVVGELSRPTLPSAPGNKKRATSHTGQVDWG